MRKIVLAIAVIGCVVASPVSLRQCWLGRPVSNSGTKSPVYGAFLFCG